MARKLVTDSKSIISEQFRTIRTNIRFSLPDQEIKSLLVTSSIPGEGKSTNAANLGVVFAQEGKRVIIIDADMRKPTLHHTFSTINTDGLSDVLTRQKIYLNVIQKTSVEELSIIPSGPLPPNPVDLLSSKTMEILMQDLRKDYDIIIIDAPPLLSVSDSQILSNKCDGTILVVNMDLVKKVDVLKAKATLVSSKAQILGVVLNNVKTPKNHYYY
ncbi:CpsD/CapB family tyrosine-protein kinase [Lysinibacillus xylanilyticus]|uniref:non-specific protein-tyrosine kinase n=1 Tax=Lysinibacillus xylanilyticus TaxID=582475 RepID=A0A0K9F5I0_9BACI|nr:capsular biosynthesis protein [Lysinibacillus xylanilyticus]